MINNKQWNRVIYGELRFFPLQYVITYHAGYSSSWIFIIIVHSIFQLHQSWCSLYDQWSTQYIDSETRFAMENCGFPLEFVMTLYSDLLLFFINVHKHRSFNHQSSFINLDALCMINDQKNNETELTMESCTLYSALLLFFINFHHNHQSSIIN